MRLKIIGAFLLLGFTIAAHGEEEIDAFYNEFKNAEGMESRKIPPKLATLFLDDEEYPEVEDILMSLTSMKYLNFYGDREVVEEYAQKAAKASTGYQLLDQETDKKRWVKLFGQRKNGFVKKVFAVLSSHNQFTLVIGKGKLTDDQIALFPELVAEIQ